MARSRGLVDRICECNAALSESKRVKMMKIMGSSDANSVMVSDFADILGISQPSATKHLKILHRAELIDRKRIGTRVFYSLNIEAIAEYHRLLDLAFEMGFRPCPYGYNCDECPEKETCT